MPTDIARIETDRAERFLKQFCDHARAMGVSAEREQSQGVVVFPDGRCTLTADATALLVQIEATDDQALRRIRDIVTRDFQRFGGRTPLAVAWSHRPRSWVAPAVAVGVLIAIAVHAGLAGAALRRGWTVPLLVAVLAAVAVKLVALLVVRRKTGRFGHHRPTAHG
ncbi:MAG: DUF2218 domain-containing protein [Hamadaea sp.]|nr:DUF2218 domain-containing protein [Hamadaea sp.]NUT04576.1 DUF2218 domain-containing protein [Hamadaea sp.]